MAVAFERRGVGMVAQTLAGVWRFRGGAPIAVTLQAGQTYKHAGGSVDLTGSTVVADQAVAVFSGHECARCRWAGRSATR